MPNTAKQEAIRKAYGEYWETYKDLVDDNGWFSNRFTGNDIPNKQLDFRTEKDDKQRPFRFRIKGLQGIENNRGWIRIESEDWLKEHRINSSTTKFYINDPDEDYFDIAIQLNDKEESIVGLSDYLFMKDILIKSNIKATHYQPIVKPEKPIY